MPKRNSIGAVFDSNPEQALEHCHGSMREAYWEMHDLPEVRRLAEQTISWGLRSAELLEAQAPEKAAPLWAKIKAVHYDLASFTWVGWNEPDILITESDRTAGYLSAQENLRLALELKKSALALSRAHWLLGAHLLAANRPASARESFLEAVAHAKTAESPEDVSINLGYAALARILIGYPNARQEFEAAIEHLAETAVGQDFVQQLKTAHFVFCGC